MRAIVTYKVKATPSSATTCRIPHTPGPTDFHPENFMQTPVHVFTDLFEQLGLPSDAEAIKRFIETKRPLAHDLALADAPFWNPGQASFIREELQRDADWAELVDQLDAALR